MQRKNHLREDTMSRFRSIGISRRVAAALVPAAALIFSASAALGQSGNPITIGYGISQTGGLAPNGQFRDTSTQVVVTQAEYKSGDMIYPYANAK
jgi:hypothetical protein